MEIIRYHEFNLRILAASVMIEEREYLAAGIAGIQLRYRIQRLRTADHPGRRSADLWTQEPAEAGQDVRQDHQRLQEGHGGAGGFRRFRGEG